MMDTFAGQTVDPNCVVETSNQPDDLVPFSASNLKEYLTFVDSKPHLLLSVEDEASRYGKAIFDPVHGFINVHPLLVRVIDTPQFQRLRFIKCLGSSDFVYPAATHTRFEHSLGVSHLARKMMEAIASRQPELCIDREEILCVALAGLLHDLGHGPFSHLWERFMKVANPEAHWEHENASISMFDHLIVENNLARIFKSFGLASESLEFIKELIVGPMNGQEYRTRPKRRRFLFEIVANKRNGIDVDKFDYLSRDGRQVGIEKWFDSARFIDDCRVIFTRDGVGQICYRDKDYTNVCDMFHTRYNMHYRVYQHRVTKVVEVMMIEAFHKADQYARIPGKNGLFFRLSEAYRCMKAYSLLKDCLLNDIYMDQREDMAPARELVGRIFRRDLYRLIGRTQPQNELNDDEEFMKNGIISCLPRLHDTYLCKASLEENLLVQKVRFDYGMKEKNPLEKVTFFDKMNPNVSLTISQAEVSRMLPENYHEVQLLILYRKNDDDEIAEVERLLRFWANKRNIALKSSSVSVRKNSRSVDQIELENLDSTRKDYAKRALFES